MSTLSKKQIILQTATRHFANAGFEGARVDEIAEEAGVNKATLYYHIGNKEVLYEAIFVEVVDNIMNNIQQELRPTDSVSVQLEKFATVFAQSLESNPYIAPLIMREIASGSAHMNDEAITKMHHIRELLANILKEGEDQHIFRPVNSFLIHILLVGTLNFYSASSNIRNKLSEKTEKNKNDLILPVTNVASEIVKLILNSICIDKEIC